MGGTSLGLDFGRGPALPFAGEPTAMTGAPPAGQKSPRPPEALVETSLALDFFARGPALPFVEGAIVSPERAPTGPVSPEPRETLTGTSLALDIPRGSGQLPFEKEAVPAESQPLAATALALDFSAAKALPFRTDKPVRPKISVRQRAVVPTQAFPVMMSPVIPPVARMPPGANPLVVPDLSLADYAALRAHLTVRGEEDPETWKHFGVTSPAVKQALQDRFAARFRQDPAAQAQFVDRLKTLVAELRARATGR
jgi:hypothetical protein